MRLRPRPVIAVSTVTLFGLLGLNAALVQFDASSLRAALDREVAQGVPAADLAAVKTSLSDRTGYEASFTSLALIGNPYADLSREATAAFQAAMTGSHQRAGDALSLLQQKQGGPAAGYADEEAALQNASTPAGLDVLTSNWTRESEVADLDRRTLGDMAGGFTADGKPQDLADLSGRLDAAVSAAAGAQVDTDPAPAARDALTAYWPLAIADRLAQHDSVKATVSGAADSVQHRADAKKQALMLAGNIDGLVATASTIGIPDDVAAEASRGKAAARYVRSSDFPRRDICVASSPRRERIMSSERPCADLRAITTVKHPVRRECEDCVKIGASWVHLRTCQTCGGTRCCDDSPNRHASKHAHATSHPVIASAEPGERWLYCYRDDAFTEY